MKHAIIFVLVAGAALTRVAVAEEDPRPGTHDPRVRWVSYDPINVVKVVATDLRSTMIQFATDETVTVVACGDQQAWAWQKAGNLLFIKPSVFPGRRSNMQVVTARQDGTRRVYQFELDPQDTAGQPVFGINFRYPDDVAEKRKKEATEAAAQRDTDMARERLDVDLFYGTRNWKYLARGSTAIQPSEVSDNGNATVFR